ncbi:CRISPR-associated protein Cas4 [uncultured Treponema sp.]|uniref:CRISPR-associated protein Cas4 n=1 Tax=uncultured Treponema sp. TaxID=162155 RepID=UPI0025E87C0B|nr:CRISPR-associated protein Cas4 [uncultured Treponema sp.]
MYQESDYLLLSGLQHIKFCPRQCALIHIEQLWHENFFTASGRAQHEKVHSGVGESRRIVRTERDLKIASSFLGITGQTDAVEFYSDGTVIPIEYKHGEPKEDSCDEVQLCAQVICLEEMLGCKIEEGALYYFKIRRRIPVKITDELRLETIELARKFHELVESGKTPLAEYKRKCESCSFIDECFPESAGRNKSVETYLKRRIQSETIGIDEV